MTAFLLGFVGGVLGAIVVTRVQVKLARKAFDRGLEAFITDVRSTFERKARTPPGVTTACSRCGSPLCPGQLPGEACRNAVSGGPDATDPTP